MMNSFALGTAMLFFLLLSKPALAGSPEQAVRDNETKFTKSAIANDGKVYDELLAEDFRGVNCDGSVQGKKEYADNYRSGNFKLTVDEQSEIKIRTVDTCIIFEALCVQHGTYNGADGSGEYRIFDVWMKQPNGSSRCISAQWT